MRAFFVVLAGALVAGQMGEGASPPSLEPSPPDVPTDLPSDVPSDLPSDLPSGVPSDLPTGAPSSSGSSSTPTGLATNPNGEGSDSGEPVRVPGRCPGFGGDALCQLESPGSYCKFYQFPAVCLGTNTPCACGSCPNGDDSCKATAGAASYCKFWLTQPVCQGSDTSCACSNRRLRLLQQQPQGGSGDNGQKDEHRGGKDMHDTNRDNRDMHDNDRDNRDKHDKKNDRDRHDKDRDDGNKKEHRRRGDDHGDDHGDDYGDDWAHDDDYNDDYGRDDKDRHDQRCPLGDYFCKSRTGKHWSWCDIKYGGSAGYCAGNRDIKCSCKPISYDCQKADAYCAMKYHGSHCQFWKPHPTCSGTKKPCKCNPKRW